MKRKYSEEQKEKNRVRARAYYQANKERVKEYQKEYRKLNPLKVFLREKNYKQKHKAEINKRRRENYVNTEELKAYRKANKEKVLMACKKWRENNREEHNFKNQKWKNENPNKVEAETQAYCNIKIPTEQLCESCNKEYAVDRHHEDYDKPLEVMLVCKSCHYKLDEQRRERELVFKQQICEVMC